MRTLPLPELTGVQNELVRRAFLLLLETGRPVTRTQLSVATGTTEPDVDSQLDVLATAGRVRRDDHGAVTGALGLTLDETRHEVVVNGAVWHTWCAIDALGILSALGATGVVRSTSPQTGKPIEIHFADGRPVAGDLTSVVYLAAYRTGDSVVDNWCPNVNLFESDAAATGWAGDNGVGGDCVPLAGACELAGYRWRERLYPGTTPQ